MKKTETKYYCDICGREVKNQELHEIVLPIECYTMDCCATGKYIMARFEICNDCGNKIHLGIKKELADIFDREYCGINILLKGRDYE